MINAKKWIRGDTQRYQTDGKNQKKKSSTDKSKAAASRNKQTDNSTDKIWVAPRRPATSQTITSTNDKRKLFLKYFYRDYYLPR